MLELGLRRWKDFYSQGNGLEETQKRGPELDQFTVAGARVSWAWGVTDFQRLAQERVVQDLALYPGGDE